MKLLSHTRFVAAAALASAAIGGVTAAHAGTDVVFSVGFQAPAYVQPAPGYVVQSQPVYVQRQPVYQQAPYYEQRERGYRYQRDEEAARGQPEWHDGDWQQHHRHWQQPYVQRWVQGRVYEAGSIVQYGGRLYIAKMWNAGSLPTPNQWGWSDWTPYRS